MIRRPPRSTLFPYTTSSDLNIAEIKFDSQDESVNKFDKNSLNELNEVVKLLGKDQSVKGLLISSGKESFIVGADINQFLGTFQIGRATPELQSLVNLVCRLLLEQKNTLFLPHCYL